MTKLRISKLQYDYPPDDPEYPNFGLDFSSRGPLYPPLKKTMFFGSDHMPDRIEHCNEDGVVVVREDYIWEINEEKTEVLSRTRTIVWLDEEGNDHPKQKVVHKIYPKADRKKHLIRRRKRVIQKIEDVVLGFLKQTLPQEKTDQEASSFKIELLPLINLFVEDNSDYLREYISTAQKDFLDFEISQGTSLRAYIISLLEDLSHNKKR